MKSSEYLYAYYKQSQIYIPISPYFSQKLVSYTWHLALFFFTSQNILEIILFLNKLTQLFSQLHSIPLQSLCIIQNPPASKQIGSSREMDS